MKEGLHEKIYGSNILYIKKPHLKRDIGIGGMEVPARTSMKLIWISFY